MFGRDIPILELSETLFERIDLVNFDPSGFDLLRIWVKRFGPGAVHDMMVTHHTVATSTTKVPHNPMRHNPNGA